ncbi:hypothetical protein BGZ47_004021 [Haplosporangium gracile]|nr:hypothetical protein BGZ47_004021 [Haplosporangium gracile]
MAWVFAFLDSYGIGANDVNNSFGAAVSSKALNLKQAVLIATICEFLGAFLMGSSTADTIKGGLIDVDLFAAQPELLMLGMVCSLVGSFTWIMFASSHGWPVSTTHVIVGAITGIGLAGFEGGAVHWVEIGKIVSSWLISSICAGLITTFIFLITKFLILRHGDSSTSHPLSPDDSKAKSLDDTPRFPRGSVSSGLAALDDTPAPSRAKQLFNKIKAKAIHGLDQDIHDNTPEVGQIHGNSPVYDEKTEKLFCTLQVLTSCFASFAHESNDVANAIGPLTTIYYVRKNGAVDVTGKAPIPPDSCLRRHCH